MEIRIFTDGACSSNPGPGGWAALFALSEEQIMISGGESQTTNNRMELMGVISALEKTAEDWNALNEWDEYDGIVVISDSAYVVNAMRQGWLKAWKRNGWVTVEKKNVKNHDLWIRLDQSLQMLEKEGIKVNFVKVKGHAGNTFNEMVDERARAEVLKIKEGRC